MRSAQSFASNRARSRRARERKVPTMTGTFKRMGAVLAAVLVLVVGLAAPSSALAVEPTASVTYNGIEAGNTLKAYRVVSFDAENNNNVYKYDTTFTKYLDSKGVTDKDFVAMGYDSDDLRTLINGFLSYDGVTSMTPAYTVTADDNNTVTQNFTPGYYVISVATTEGHTTVYSASSLFVRYNGNDALLVYSNGSAVTPSNNTYTIDVKSAKGATLSKSIARADGTWAKTKTVSMGEYVQYGLQITLPDYSGITFGLDVTVSDTLTNLQFVNDGAHPMRAYAGTSQSTGAAFDGVTVEAGAYDDTTHTQKLTFKIDYTKLSGGAKTLMISYWALPTSDMVSTGTMNGTNSATLSYNTSAAGTRFTTTASNTTVYTYGLKLTKFGSLSDEKLAGAKFQVFADAASTDAMSFIPLKDTSGNIIYYQYTTDANASGAVTEIETGDDGTFQIRGIDAASNKSLYIQETVAPAGYKVPSGRFAATLASDKSATDGEHNGKLSNMSSFTAQQAADTPLVQKVSVDDANLWQLDVELNNANTHVLPTTGGMGTVLFAVVGVALMAAAAGAFVVVRRRRQ